MTEQKWLSHSPALARCGAVRRGPAGCGFGRGTAWRKAFGLGAVPVAVAGGGAGQGQGWRCGGSFGAWGHPKDQVLVPAQGVPGQRGHQGQESGLAGSGPAGAVGNRAEQQARPEMQNLRTREKKG